MTRKLAALFTGRLEKEDGRYLFRVPKKTNQVMTPRSYLTAIIARQSSDSSASETSLESQPPSSLDSSERSAESPEQHPPVHVGDVHSVVIEDKGSEGDGLTRINGFVVFIPDAEIGEQVQVKISDVFDQFAFAERM